MFLTGYQSVKLERCIPQHRPQAVKTLSPKLVLMYRYVLLFAPILILMKPMCAICLCYYKVVKNFEETSSTTIKEPAKPSIVRSPENIKRVRLAIEIRVSYLAGMILHFRFPINRLEGLHRTSRSTSHKNLHYNLHKI